MSEHREGRGREPRHGWALLAVGLAAFCGACGGDPHGKPLEITVPRGASLHQVTDSLGERGIIDHERFFRAYARLRRADRSIRAGRYAFRQGTGWGRIVDDLTAGRVLTTRMTIPEGFTLRQMIPRLARVTGLHPDTVRARLAEDSLEVRFAVPGPGLEGYLFPDTYRFAPGVGMDRVLRTMTDRYRRFWTPERRARLDSLGMTEREVATLASIIQAEARRLEEMPTISSVYHNRLERRYPLQADPTVLYALGGPRERLLYAAIDSVEDNPYNTYTQPGLPPGPIAAPGEAALEAALQPADTDFFYFVARPTGEHVFTRTLAEHNRAKAAARREWDTAEAAVGTRGPAEDTTADADSLPPGR